MTKSPGQVPRALTEAYEKLWQILRQNRMMGVPDLPPEFLRGNHTHEGLTPIMLLLEAQLASFPNAFDVIAHPNHVCFAVERFVNRFCERSDWSVEFIRRADYAATQCSQGTTHHQAKTEALSTVRVDLSQEYASEWLKCLGQYDPPVKVSDIVEEESRTTRVLNGSLSFFTLDATAQAAFEKWHTECRRIMREADRIETRGCWTIHQIHLQAEDKPPDPPKCLGPLFEACKFHQPIRDDGLLATIESAANSLMDWVEDQESSEHVGRLGLKINRERRIVSREVHSKWREVELSQLHWHTFSVFYNAGEDDATLVQWQSGYPGEWDARHDAVKELKSRIKVLGITIEPRHRRIVEEST